MASAVRGAEETQQIPAKCSDNEWFITNFTMLVRDALKSPSATVEIADKSKWVMRRIRGADRWLCVVLFKAEDKEHKGTGYSVFIYNPVTEETEIMTPEEAGKAVAEGKKDMAI
jgi:hypothetical protein